MKGLVKLAIFAAVVFYGSRYLLEKKAASMVDVARSMVHDGRLDEANEELDLVQGWLGWTEAAGEVEGVRKKVRLQTQERQEQADWDRRMREEDARYDQQQSDDARLKLEKERMEQDQQNWEREQAERRRREEEESKRQRERWGRAGNSS